VVLLLVGWESHDDVCAEICAHTGLEVVAVDYRLSPEHLHPAGLNDALAVISALQTRVVLVGDSAGGNLAAACAQTLKSSDIAPLGQVLIYPGLGGDMKTGSYLRHANAPMLTLDDVLFYQNIRHDGPAPQDDPSVSPLRATDFRGLPPTVAISAQCDPLADDARDYVARLTEAGVNAHWIEELGLVHGYLRARATVPRAAASFGRICLAVETMAQEDWRYGEQS
jgi:acetyl esterase